MNAKVSVYSTGVHFSGRTQTAFAPPCCILAPLEIYQAFSHYFSSRLAPDFLMPPPPPPPEEISKYSSVL